MEIHLLRLMGYGDLPVEYSTWGLPDPNLISTAEVADANPFDMVRAFNSPYVYIPSPTGNLLPVSLRTAGISRSLKMTVPE